ncbi:hypothetical protein B0H34DRAFT_683548 [Crassisporium funariophilum]|nr:hypothetical protein B0H34DRAFT_683548 [Crassisporium funariophilum]
MPSKDIIIIIAISIGVPTVFILFFLARFISRRTSSSAPLPQVQPLAHHREHQLSKLENSLPRAQTWYYPNHLTTPHSFRSSSPGGSKASLIAKNPESPSPSAETITEDSAAFSPLDQDQLLPVPSPSFHSARPASPSSQGSSDPGHTSPASLWARPPNTLSTPPFDPPTIPHLRSSSSSPGPPRRPRPHSIASSTYSRTSRNTQRGVPHGPHSQIQIVLPAPLASNLSDARQRDQSRRPVSRFDTDSLDRRSVVDKWVLAGTLSMPELPPSSTPIAASARDVHRAVSSPSLSASSHARKSFAMAEPVPAVPSIYMEESDGKTRRLQKRRQSVSLNV